jgi:hypothetical protein
MEAALRRNQLIFCTVLVAASALAQSHVGVAEREPASEAVGKYPIAQSLPAAPQSKPIPPKVMDLKFIAVMSTLAAAESLRYTTRTLVLEHELRAGDPFIGNIPSHYQFGAKTLAIYAAELAVGYELKKAHGWLPGDKVIRRLWWVYPAVMIQAHFRNASGNINTTGPGGCTSVQTCEAP